MLSKHAGVQALSPRWEELCGDDAWVARVAREGFRVKTWRPPGVMRGPDFRGTPEQVAAIDGEVSDMLASGAIREVFDGPANAVYSTIFCVDKPGGAHRPCLNLKPLNRFVCAPKFRLPSVRHAMALLRPSDKACVLDLSKAYFHVPMHEDSRRLLRFHWRGRRYEFQCLPFGLNCAPWVFTRMLRPLRKRWNRLGIRCVVYLDDILVMGTGAAETAAHRDIVMRDLAYLGLTLNERKSQLNPTSTVTFLGFKLHAKTMSVSLPDAKLRRFRREAAALLNAARAGRDVHIRSLARFLGFAEAASAAVAGHRLALQSLHDTLRAALPRGWSSRLHLSSPACRELEWWRATLPHWVGRRWTTDVDAVLTTDASPHGWGGVLSSPTSPDSPRWKTADRFPAALARMSSNTRELAAVWLALRRLARTRWAPPSGALIRVRSDNTTTVAYINRQGGKFRHLNSLQAKVLSLCAWRGWTLSAVHLPGVLNPLADALSRMHSSLADGLPTSLMRARLRRFALCDRITRVHHHSAVVDHLHDRRRRTLLIRSSSLHLLVKYLPLIPRTWALITPAWDVHSWFGALLAAGFRPLVLGTIGQTLRFLTSTTCRPEWRLIVWRFCGKSAGGRATPQRKRRCAYDPGGGEHTRPTPSTGATSCCGQRRRACASAPSRLPSWPASWSSPPGPLRPSGQRSRLLWRF
ncbi:MAG: hypothetical protein GY772_02710 [bacterium]|nr:hypothetical protein [bacterium]